MTDHPTREAVESLQELFDAGFQLAKGRWHTGVPWESWAISKRDEAIACAFAALRALTPPATPEPYQARVDDWVIACFGATIARDTVERNHRFLEEALELVQANGCTASEAHQLVDYTFGRPIGEPAQEVGGVMNTLAALCNATGIDMTEAAEAEMVRCWANIEKTRAKQKAKPKHSPLPEAATPEPAGNVVEALDSVIKRALDALIRCGHHDVQLHIDADVALAALRAHPHLSDAAKQAGGGWQPIETAPKDGMRVLLWWPSALYAPVASYRIFEGGDEDGSGCVWGWALDDEIITSNGDGWLVYEDDPEPTHWQSLPTAPTTKQEPSDG